MVTSSPVSSSSSKTPRVALVYDRVNTPFGGAENVLRALHQIYPDAPLYTSVYDKEEAKWAKDFSVKSSFIQKIPTAKKSHRVFVPFMPLAFESFDFSDFDVVISITSAEAKGVLTKPHQLHVCYLLTPTRYLWSHQEEYESDWLTGWIRKPIFRYIKWWDQAACLRPDVYIPISQLVEGRCQRFYRRSTEEVIYPPVSLTDDMVTAAERPSDVPEEYYLIISRLVSYKRIDLAIQTCQKMHRNLVIIGQGPDYERLQRIVKNGNPTAKIIFLQAVQASELHAYYKNCRAFLLPAEEDFGITGLEAQMYGKPVVVYHKSGVAEIIQDQVTGVHFFFQTPESMGEAIKSVEQVNWSQEKIRQSVQQYDTKHFKQQFQATIMKLWERFVKEKGMI
jgi:glycosyltransferase involved in cell wall biosynthesis